MRNLIYVPIIHASADLGSMASELHKKGIADFGEEFWQQHIETINGFWEAIRHYFDSIDMYIEGTKIYQDGMVADGEVAEQIIQDSVKAGSINYQIVSDLIQKGAVIIQTEKLDLVKKELVKLQSITMAKSSFAKIMSLIMYKITKSSILKTRDKFIANQINTTLKEDETGILFIGAYHNIMDKLPSDIQVIELKDMAKIRRYHKLLPFHKRFKEEFEQLAEYLIKK